MSGKNPNVTDEMKAFVNALFGGDSSGFTTDSLSQLYAALPWISIGLLLAIFFAQSARKKKDNKKKNDDGE